MFDSYSVQRIDFATVKRFMEDNHYARGMANNTSGAFGLFESIRGMDFLIGAISFNTPVSENVRRAVFGPDMVDHVLELSRLCILDVTPPNAESWFIARAMRALADLRLEQGRPPIFAVVTFSDPTFGHVGTIYQATNSVYTGTGKREPYFIDSAGRRHPDRICGRNLSRADGEQRGWQYKVGMPKHRYVFLRPVNRWHARELHERMLLESQPYPKLGSTSNGFRR